MYSMLIVDDHKHLVESLAETIPWQEYEVGPIYRAYSGSSALEFIVQHDIDIVLTDIQMPEISGLDLIERVRMMSRPPECILLTGYADFEYAKRAIELHAFNYILKPVRDEELIRSVQSIITKLKLQRNNQAAAANWEELLQQSLKEERRRIAHDLHDTVGHTLTSTIVQIEAAKRLIASGRQEGMGKLEQSQELVRKGLADLRETVSYIRHYDGKLELQELLLRFIQEAEQMGDIRIDIKLQLNGLTPEPALTVTVLQTLKEGITNGIRHGKAQRFELTAECSGQELMLMLWNNGLPYDGHSVGFGLSAMRERIAGIGGTVRLARADSREGSVLHVLIPLQTKQEGS